MGIQLPTVTGQMCCESHGEVDREGIWKVDRATRIGVNISGTSKPELIFVNQCSAEENDIGDNYN